MNIELNAGRVPSATPPAPAQGPRPAAPASDEVKFTGTAALEEALAKLPESRPEVVQRTKEVLASGEYPSEPAMDRVANLLASKLDRPEEP
jgi:hypothetical protein